MGDAAGFVDGVSNLLAELGEDDTMLDAEISDLLERVRYGGQTLPVEALDRLQRDVERRLESLRENPETKEREAVRLAEEEE